jgi:hypothetical protein
LKGFTATVSQQCYINGGSSSLGASRTGIVPDGDLLAASATACATLCDSSHFRYIPGPFGFILADLNGKIGPQRLDYSRPGSISDHDYVRKLLRQSIDELSDGPELRDDDGSDCDKAIEEYWTYRSSLN